MLVSPLCLLTALNHSDRDDYERIARELRYNAYKELLAAHGGLNAGVVFGHHQGDLQENVISNVMRGCSPLQLAGMAEASSSHGVEVWRPLLRHSKEEIFAFAHRYGVPYFRDTTPTWSTRGKLRRQLLPLLREMYGEGFLRNLSSLAAASDANRELLEASLYQPFMTSVRRLSCGLKVPVLRWALQPECFWAEMLRRLMHLQSMSMVRDSSVANFVAFIHRRYASQAASQPGDPLVWLELRKGFFTFLSPADELVVFRDGVFAKSTSVSVELLSIPADRIRLGAWYVNLKVEPCTDEAEYHIESWENVLEGSFSYLIRPRRECRRLTLIDAEDQAKYLGCAKAKKRGDAGDIKVLFRTLDRKVRHAIPFLVEAEERLSSANGGENNDEPLQIRLAYFSALE